MGYPHVYIIILNWNGWQDTIDCLNSLKQATYPHFSVVVVDNASTDESVEKIKDWTYKNSVPFSEYLLNSRDGKPRQLVQGSIARHGFLRLELICSSVNLGFCAGNNVGIEFSARAGADYFLILNNDTICEPNFLEPMIQAAQGNNAGLVGGLICFADDPHTIWWSGGRFNAFLETKRVGNLQPVDGFKQNGIFETEWISGCMMLIPRYIFESIGGFDEKFFIWSEEWDISLRVRKNGYKLLVAPSAKIYHKIGKSLGVMVPLYYYYGTRNRLLLKKKHLNRIMRVFFLTWFIPTRIVRYTQFLVKGRFDLVNAGLCAIRDYFSGRTGKWNQHAE